MFKQVFEDAAQQRIPQITSKLGRSAMDTTL
jgi:hypothetical protein